MPTDADDLTEELTAELIDVVFKIKAAVEDADWPTLRGLFAPNPQIVVEGRFLQLDEFLDRLRMFAEAGHEHLVLDVVRIDQVDYDEKTRTAFIDVETESSWIDAHVWEEQRAYGNINLTLVRARDLQVVTPVPPPGGEQPPKPAGKGDKSPPPGPPDREEPQTPERDRGEPSAQPGAQPGADYDRERDWLISGFSYKGRTHDDDVDVREPIPTPDTREPSGWTLGLDNVYGLIEFWL